MKTYSCIFLNSYQPLEKKVLKKAYFWGFFKHYTIIFISMIVFKKSDLSYAKK